MSSRSSSEPEPEIGFEEVMITHLEVWLLIKILSTLKKNV